MNKMLHQYSTIIITENMHKVLIEIDNNFQPFYVLTRSRVTSDSVIGIWCSVWDKLVAYYDVWMAGLPKSNYYLRWDQYVGYRWSHTSIEKDNSKMFGFVIRIDLMITETRHWLGQSRNDTLAPGLALWRSGYNAAPRQTTTLHMQRKLSKQLHWYRGLNSRKFVTRKERTEQDT